MFATRWRKLVLSPSISSIQPLRLRMIGYPSELSHVRVIPASRSATSLGRRGSSERACVIAESCVLAREVRRSGSDIPKTGFEGTEDDLPAGSELIPPLLVDLVGPRSVSCARCFDAGLSSNLAPIFYLRCCQGVGRQVIRSTRDRRDPARSLMNSRTVIRSPSVSGFVTARSWRHQNHLFSKITSPGYEYIDVIRY